MAYLKIINIFYTQTLANLPTASLVLPRQAMIKSEAIATFSKSDLHSGITRLSRRNTGLQQSEHNLFSVLPGPRTTEPLCDCEHTEDINHSSVS